MTKNTITKTTTTKAKHRPTKRRVRTARGPSSSTLTTVALSGALVAGAALYTETMTTVVARRRSKIMTKLKSMRKKGQNPTAAAIRTSEQTMHTLATEPVSITARDGTALVGHWYHAEAPTRLIIMAHGWHSSWSINFGTSAPFYHDAGCELLFVEQRCHGESGGTLISYGIKERYDMLDWLDYVLTQRKDLPIYLCGLSMGASTVLMAAGEAIADKVTGVIADCGYTSPQEIVTLTLAKRLGGAAGPTVKAVNMNCRLRGGFELDDYSTIDAMKKNTEIPILFIHGDADDFVPCRMTLENYLACNAPKELYIVHGATHATSYLKETDIYQSRVLSFFATWDTRLATPS